MIVAVLFGVIFSLMSLCEIFGGHFLLYRALNLAALLSFYFALRKKPSPVARSVVSPVVSPVDHQPLPSV